MNTINKHFKTNRQTKKGFTLVEVVITIFVIGLFVVSIFSLANYIVDYQTKRKNRQNCMKIIENIHARYLFDPSFLIDNQSDTLYFDNQLIMIPNNGDIYCTVTYRLDVIDDEVQYKSYSLVLLEVKINHDLIIFSNIDLGKWVVTYD